MTIEPVAHMYPSDLERFAESETFATAFSVAVGNPDERSVPLYLHPPAPAWHDAPTCKWKPDDSESGTWASGCGELWQFNDGGPKENHVRFCQGCGKPVVMKEQSA